MREGWGIGDLIDIDNHSDRQIETRGARAPRGPGCEVVLGSGASPGAHSLAVAQCCVNVKIVAVALGWQK